MNRIAMLALTSLPFVAACGSSGTTQPSASSVAAHTPDVATVPVALHGTADARAQEIADRVMQRLGGAAAWEKLHYVTWNFFGRRRHVWDKWTGDLRIENGPRVILMNVNSGKGRVFESEIEVTTAAERDRALEQGRAMWINDAYWMFMPYKLRDPGVHLAYVGADKLAADGRAADVLEMTFESVGLTPQNRYRVLVAQDTGLVEQWSYFENAADPEPKFTQPWSRWQKFRTVEMCTDHGDGKDWEIAVFDELPRSVFESEKTAQLPRQ